MEDAAKENDLYSVTASESEVVDVETVKEREDGSSVMETESLATVPKEEATVTVHEVEGEPESETVTAGGGRSDVDSRPIPEDDGATERRAKARSQRSGRSWR